MSGKYISREKENFIKRSFKGIGYWLLGDFMCFIVCTTMLVLMKKFLMLKFMVALCTTILTLGLYFNWAHYAAKGEKNAAKFHNMEYDTYMTLKMALVAPIVSYVMLIILFLCKAGIIQETFFSLFLLCDIWILPFITLFTEETAISNISWAGVAGISFLVLLQPITIAVTYILTYRDIDVAKIIFYKKDKN